MRVSLRARVGAVAAGVAVGLAGLAALPAHAGAAASDSAAAAGYSSAGALSGVAAASASNAWAVGYAGSQAAEKVLMLHWNGKSWARMTSPKILDGTGALSAVTVVSAKDAWAVGTTGGTTASGHALILHWNGKAWSQVTGVPTIPGQLFAVTATASSVWAVGTFLTPAVIAPLIVHWNGKTWSRSSIKLNPNSQSESILTGVAVTAAKTAWAVGYTSQGIPSAVLAHWNGSTWNTTDTSFPFKSGIQRSLNGAAAGPHGTAFAVGSGAKGPGFGGPSVPLSMRWTGKAWQKASVSGPNNSGLNSVAFAPGGTAWATGYRYTSSATLALIMRWTGKTWVTVAIPGGTYQLARIGFAAPGYGWAVGAKGSKTLILHWNGHSWR